MADAAWVVASLERFYGALALPPPDPFRAYVWDVLSVQTTVARRDAAWQALQRARALTPDGLWRVPRRTFDEIVAHAGPYHEQRSAALLATVERFRRDPALPVRLRGPIRVARRAAATLPRVGVDGAHRLLLFGGGHRIAPIHPEAARFWLRLAGPPALPHPRRLRREFEAVLPREVGDFARAVTYLRHHAAQTCTNEPHCGVCPLRARCARVGLSAPPDATPGVSVE